MSLWSEFRWEDAKLNVVWTMVAAWSGRSATSSSRPPVGQPLIAFAKMMKGIRPQSERRSDRARSEGVCLTADECGLTGAPSLYRRSQITHVAGLRSPYVFANRTFQRSSRVIFDHVFVRNIGKAKLSLVGHVKDLIFRRSV